MTVLAAPVLPGETLAGKYRVERVLGRGGMGVVVAARHLELDERVAIKFLVDDASMAAVERFTREARAAVKVKGEHVCRVFDFGRLESGEPYIVMEYLEGRDLARKLQDEGPQSSSAVAGWMVEVCDALAGAHAAGIVHRDIKPANIFLARRPDGSSCAKVLDFGISKLASHAHMTGSAATVGSPAYMSPEQVDSARDVDARADIWSLGATAYELLSGTPPFAADSMLQMAVMIREREPAPLTGVPDALARAVMKCLAKERAARFASVNELAAAVAPCAPPDVAGIVARLCRVASRPDGDDETDVAMHPTVVQDGGHDVDRIRATFAPLQSTKREVRPPTGAGRRTRLAVAGIALTVAGALGVFVARTRTTSSRESLVDAALSVATIAPSEGAGASPTENVPTPAISAAAPQPAAVVTPSARTAATFASRAAPSALASSVASTSAPRRTDSSASAASSATSSATPPTESKKRRELDREDP